MSRALRWTFILLPCVPGLTLLLAAGGAWLASLPSLYSGSDGSARASANMERAWQLLMAGSVVLLAGLGIGAFVAWRIAHPRPEPADEETAAGPPDD